MTTTPAARRRRSRRARALLSLAAVALVASGMSVKGTFAFWTDAASVQTGTFTSGTLDVTLNGQLAGPANNGGTWTNNSYALTTMMPGESYAFSFPIRNNGTVPLAFTVKGTGSGDLAVATGLRYLVTFGSAATNSTVNSYRTGACGATTSTETNTTALTAAQADLVATSRNLAVGASETVCIIARLSTSAGNALQDKQGSASILFDAKQLGQ